MIPDQ